MQHHCELLSIARSWSAAGAFFALVLASHCLDAEAAQPPVGNQPLAQVGQTVIDQEMVAETLEERFGDLQVSEADRRTFEQAALLSLVKRQWAFERLVSLGGTPLTARIEHRIDSELKSRKRSQPAATLSSSERAKIAWQLAWDEYLQQHLNEENLHTYYSQFHWRYDGTRAEVAQIFIKATPESQADLVQLKKRIEGGEIEFNEAALEYSQSPSRLEGGKIGWVEGGEAVPPEVAELALTGKVGTVVGPIKSSRGWHLLHISQRLEGSRQFADFADRARLKKDVVDYLFGRLAEEGAKKHPVKWLSTELQPSDDVQDRL